MTTISAEIVDDAVNENGNRITTIRTRYPRWIHAEGRTHRQLTLQEYEFKEDFDEVVLTDAQPRTPSPMEDRNLSRNASSSRAIPVKKMIDAIFADPAVPIYWGSNKPGMQAGEELTGEVRERAIKEWHDAMNDAIYRAILLNDLGCHKQIVNRLLEPFMHIEVLFTATEWSNFFALRIHDAAEPHIKLLAEQIKAAMDSSTPRLLRPGEWYLPYVMPGIQSMPVPDMTDENLKAVQMLSVARCAHLSYETVGTGELIDLTHAERIFKQLLGPPLHASPFEHQAIPDIVERRSGPTREIVWQNPKQHGNLVGFRQLRKMLPGECQ